MKRFLNGKMRMLSLLLSLVLAVGLMPTICLTASAVSHLHIDVTPTLGATSFHPNGSLKSVQITVTFPSNSYGTAYGKIALHNGEPQHDSGKPYSSYYSDWPTDYSGDPTFIAIDTETEFQWTGNAPNKTWTRTLTFAQDQVPLGTYSLYMWTRCPTVGSSRGVYADAFLANVTVGSNNVSLGSGSAQHTHSWQITGDNTDTLTATCGGQGTCGAGGPVSVSISASSVTLPSSPFNAKVSNAQQFEAVTGFKVRPLNTLQRPGYKFKAVGASSFTDPDMNNPQAGTYQAIIYVEDASGTQHSAFVEYHAIDPVQTAATGDNRPIEMMVMGMACFSVLAIAAFVFDSKRRVHR